MHQPGVLPVFPVFCSVRRFGETFRLTGNRDRRQDKDHRAEIPRPWPRKRPVYSSSPQAERTGAETRTVFCLECLPRRWRENRRERQSRRPSQQTRRTCGRKSNRETRNAGAPEKKEPALCGKKEIKRAPAVPAGALVCFICTWEFTWCSVLPLRGTSEQLHF